jgi:hypothetical protein
MKPKPFSSLNHFTVPVAIAGPPLEFSAADAEDAEQRPATCTYFGWN